MKSLYSKLYGFKESDLRRVRSTNYSEILKDPKSKENLIRIKAQSCWVHDELLKNNLVVAETNTKGGKRI